jgi:hypothetical protein
MRGDAIIFELKTFNKLCSGLITWSFENPHSAYSDRCNPFQQHRMIFYIAIQLEDKNVQII